MIEIGVEYQVVDGSGRAWGTVLLRSTELPTNRFSELSRTYWGKLNPSSEFEEVQPIFLAHEKWADEALEHDESFERSCEKIAALNVALENRATGEKIPVSPVFVNSELLFTC